MAGRNKNLAAVNRRNYKISIPTFSGGIDTTTDERILPLNKAEVSYNFCCDTGALTEGWGFEIFTKILNGRSVWLYTRKDKFSSNIENILMYCSSVGEIFYRRTPTAAFQKLEGLRFSGLPYTVNYRLYGEDVIIICSAKDKMAVWNGIDSAYIITDSPLITSLTLHYERMFVTTANEPNSVWFSDDLDPTNWNPELDEGGFIELLDERGKLNKVISFNNYIYVFRDYGISRLTAFASQGDFNAVNLFTSSGRIYADSVAMCGDVILFLAADGLYSFDGVSTRRILKNLDGLLCSGGRPYACYHEGKYVVTFCADIGEEKDKECNNCVMVYNRHSGACDLMWGMDIHTLCPVSDGVGETMYMITYSGLVGMLAKNGTHFPGISSKVWQSGNIDFGSADKKKHIREFYIDTLYDITVTFNADGTEHSFFVRGSEKISRVRLNVSGYKIGLKISAQTAKASIARPQIVYSLR